MTHTRKPAERTLKEMLREADEWIAQTALPNTAAAVRRRLEEAVRRAADVARQEDLVWHKAADAILADAGLDEEERDE